jgi:hypothetical protein
MPNLTNQAMVADEIHLYVPLYWIAAQFSGGTMKSRQIDQAPKPVIPVFETGRLDEQVEPCRSLATLP